MRREYRLLYLLALLKLILPFLLQNGVYEPHRDEFLYLAEGRHPAWGFMEVPPLLSVFAWLTNLFGGGFFWIKFWPSLFGALTYLLVGRMVLSLGGKQFALFLSFLPFVFGAFLSVHYLFQPNFLDFFFWTLLAYSLVRCIRQETSNEPASPKWLYLAGVSIGLGLLSKYSMLFFAISVIGGLLLTPQRRLLLNRHSLYALALAFVLFLPNLWWQWNHGFPVVYHMNELRRTQLQYISRSAFFTEQVLLNLPCIFVWTAGLIAAGFARAVRPYRFIAWSFLLVMTLLALGHAKGYYALGVYPILFAFGAVELEQRTVKRLYFLRYVLIVFALVVGCASVMIDLPILPPRQLAEHYAKTGIARNVGALRWEDLKDHPLPQDFADMLSWKEMTRKVAEAYATLTPEEKSQTLLFCDNYGQAGAVNYYGPQFDLPLAYSANGSFLYWMPEDYYHFNVLLLVADDRNEMQHPFIKQFASARLMDSITNPYAREFGTVVVLLKGPSILFTNAFRDKITKAKYKTTAAGASSSHTPANALEKGGALHK